MSVPSLDSPTVQALLVVLSVTAGCMDIIGFLGLSGLLTAHITGNLVILAAHIVAGDDAQIAPMLSVPVFIAVVGLTRLLAGGLESIGLASLRPLLLLQFLLLAGFLVLCVAAGPRIDPNATNAIVAGMLGVMAMAVQNTLVQISVKEAPTTAVMTTNVTHFAMDVGEVLLRRNPAKCGQGAKPGDAYPAGDCGLCARLRPRCGVRGRTWPLVARFACRPRPACGCRGICGRSGWRKGLKSQARLWPPDPSQTYWPDAARADAHPDRSGAGWRGRWYDRHRAD